MTLFGDLEAYHSLIALQTEVSRLTETPPLPVSVSVHRMLRRSLNKDLPSSLLVHVGQLNTQKSSRLIISGIHLLCPFKNKKQQKVR